ncbi:hypothetical protein OSTOST_15655 [Ostertagia ostertagi]
MRLCGEYINRTNVWLENITKIPGIAARAVRRKMDVGEKNMDEDNHRMATMEMETIKWPAEIEMARPLRVIPWRNLEKSSYRRPYFMEKKHATTH